LSYFFLVKTHTSLGAMNLLWTSGFVQDALIIGRSIFETYLIDAYIRIDPTERVPRYLAYEATARRDLGEGMIRSLKNRSSIWREKWRSYTVRHGRSAKTIPYSFDDPRGWSGKSLREMVRLVETKYGNEGIWMDYEFFYALGSAVAHSSVLSIQEYMTEPHRTSYRKLGQRKRYLQELPILACRWCLIVGFLSAQDHYRIGKKTVPGDSVVHAYHLLRSLSHDLGEDIKDDLGI